MSWVALVSLPVLGMSKSGTSTNLVCAYRNETGLCESPPFFCSFNTVAERREHHNTPGERAGSLQTFPLPAPLFVTCLVSVALTLPILTLAQLDGRSEGQEQGRRSEEGKQTVAYCLSWDKKAFYPSRDHPGELQQILSWAPMCPNAKEIWGP